MTRSTSRPTQRQIRTGQRGVHLVAGALVVAYVYAAPELSDTALAVVRWLVLPVLVLSGLALWQWTRVRRALRRRGGRP